MEEKKSVNFTIIPEEDTTTPRVYSNFCSIQHSPFDFTLTFCDMQPMGEREVREDGRAQDRPAPTRRVADRAHEAGAEQALVADRVRRQGAVPGERLDNRGRVEQSHELAV